jgi:hypothetical protein
MSILIHARMAKWVDDEQDARVSRKAGAESGRKDQHNVLASSKERRIIVHPPQCPDGEIGRRKGFKIPRLNGRAGSIPAPGTIFQIKGGVTIIF